MNSAYTGIYARLWSRIAKFAAQHECNYGWNNDALLLVASGDTGSLSSSCEFSLASDKRAGSQQLGDDAAQLLDGWW